MQAEAYLLGGYERDLVRFIQREVGTGVFVDVGANVGLISVPVARTASVVAFEPHPATAEALRNNVATNEARVEVRELALGATVGTAYLQDHPYETGWSKVVEQPSEMVVSMDTLDRAMGDTRIDVMKVDAEGSEPAILRGATMLLTRQRIPCLLTEINPGHGIEASEIEGFMSRFGYRLVVNRRRPLVSASVAERGRSHYFEVVDRPPALEEVVSGAARRLTVPFGSWMLHGSFGAARADSDFARIQPRDVALSVAKVRVRAAESQDVRKHVKPRRR